MKSTTIQKFNHLVNEIDAVYHEAALKFNLSDSALLVLYTVCHSGGECLLSDITASSGISKQTINSALRRLEADDMIRLIGASRKKKTVCLTETGRAFSENTVCRLIEMENETFASWTEEERESYIALTRRFLSGMSSRVKELS